MARQTVCDCCGKTTTDGSGEDWNWTAVIFRGRSGLERELNICTTCLPEATPEWKRLALAALRLIQRKTEGA